ncbi:HAMP domain-containing sensor histidine kinase [Anaerolentibacter hominis]|uniref:sensor histidine kinase n=1 Tax=Anaerolentibacter hominis TaxID=3079009 RepID=UPI0031B8948F
MEKRAAVKRLPRGMGLNGLFWRYLITTGIFMVMLCAAWMFLFTLLVNMGFVMSAYTAARGLPETEQMLKEQKEFSPDEIPFYYEWALLEDGEIIESSMNKKQLEYARGELDGNSASHGWFYSQYFHLVPLQNGQTVMLEYDYSVCYANPDLQAALPDFQTLYIGLLLALLLLLAAMRTKHYTRLLRRDTQVITAACEMVRRQQLDEPMQGQARVRELQAALATIDMLRQELSRSLKEQWAAEQQKNEALAALAHDLKTPLTIIGGNAELLAEDNLAQPQKELVEAILRGACHAGDYVQKLREVAAENVLAKNKELVLLNTLLDDFCQRGRDLTAAKGQKLVLSPSAKDLTAETIEIEKSEVLRAVENLINNAVRFTPAGGTVTLGMKLQDGQVCLWVQDGGPGFSYEALAKAGKTFYTGDSSRPQDGHMGMGLYFASQVAKQHGGHLELENTSQGGRACLWLESRG